MRKVRRERRKLQPATDSLSSLVSLEIFASPHPSYFLSNFLVVRLPRSPPSSRFSFDPTLTPSVKKDHSVRASGTCWKVLHWFLPSLYMTLLKHTPPCVSPCLYFSHSRFSVAFNVSVSKPYSRTREAGLRDTKDTLKRERRTKWNSWVQPIQSCYKLPVVTKWLQMTPVYSNMLIWIVVIHVVNSAS